MSECRNCDYYDSCSLPEPNEKCYSKEDYVKVVRCKDCKHRNSYSDCNRLLPWDEDVYVEDDFFCKYGERKETE